MFNELLVEIKYLMDDDLGSIEFIINYISIRFSFIPLQSTKNRSAQNLYSYGDFEILFLTTVSPVRVDLWETIIIIR